MMKKLISLLLLLVFALSLVSCHGELRRKEDENPYPNALLDFEAPESFDTSKQYEITFWAKSDSNVAQTEIYRKAADMNTDSNINLKDLVRFKKYFAGLVEL